jgi:SAM-dependent methyltransferase
MTTCTPENNPVLLEVDKCKTLVQEWEKNRKEAENKLDDFLRSLKLAAPLPLPTREDAVRAFETMYGDAQGFQQIVEIDRNYHVRWRTDTICAPEPFGLINVKNSTNERLKAASNFFHWRDRLYTGDSGHDSLLDYWDRFQRGEIRRSLGGLLLRLKDTRDMMQKRGLTLYVLYYALRYTTSMVTQFPPVVARGVYDYFSPRKVLDFSAGWGDRLAAAYATPSVTSVTCIDPRPEACEKYHRQVALYEKCIRKIDDKRKMPKLKVYVDAAEDILPNLASDGYDFVFSSPCFFDKENYGTTGRDTDLQKQAHVRYRTFKEWMKHFMAPVLRECVRVLSPGGILGVHLCDIRPKQQKVDPRHPYLPITRTVFEYMADRRDAHYLGSVGARTAVRNGGVCYDPILFWKKE